MKKGSGLKSRRRSIAKKEGPIERYRTIRTHTPSLASRFPSSADSPATLPRLSLPRTISLSFSSSLAPLLLLLLRVARRNPLEVLRLALKLAPVLQLHHAPSGVGVEPRHDTPLPVQLLHLKAVQLDASANGNGRGGG